MHDDEQTDVLWLAFCTLAGVVIGFLTPFLLLGIIGLFI